ncbi:DUF4350 domain-containing protein [Sphingobacterium phlebotomi]|uniref:DUF4350 domain-containing protein n=1 Tax=Sphingobacterium phlebotomi TaxID=2605433 RepID=A0A5D4HBZ3_9SPHI|nr:DUF4350 domain-containing protein [Sphingobacterium phlebotomi]TYR37045.1 DUF4350 domain-containing protein [Sphingobacterium phlebotomi]
MKNSGKFGLILLGMTVLIIAFIDLASDKQVDWSQTYDQRDKIPYGLYVTREELPKILGNEAEIEDFTSTNYDFLKTFLPGKEQGSLVYVVNGFYEGKEVTRELINFVKKGGEVFISANSFPLYLLDTLGIKQQYHYPYNFGEVLNVEDRPFSLVDGKTAYYKDLEYPGLFSNLDTLNTHIIGYYEVEDKEIPNFIEIKKGEGRFLLHLEPLMFTNYYMLMEDNFIYGAAVLKLLSGKEIYWFDSTFKRAVEAKTPLRVLLQNDGLRQAWYILLFGLILFLLFKSKREQRAVNVVEPEPNLSKEFARTIATLYYESGNPGNLIQKKVEYFLYDIRTHFQLDILQLEDDFFAKQLSLKAGVSLEECENLIRLLLGYRKMRASTDNELIELNKRIEEFKHKANML